MMQCDKGLGVKEWLCSTCANPFNPTPYQEKCGSGRCNSCGKEYHAAWREKRRALGLPVRGVEKRSEADRKVWREEYTSRPAVKRARRERMRKYRKDSKHKKRIGARLLLSQAVKRDSIKKLPCEVCGREEVDGHHDDYDRPLDVRWLCREHHMDLHYPNRRKVSNATDPR